MPISLHTVCADRRIHSKESKALRELSTQPTIGQSTLVEMEKILTQDDNYLSLQDVARRVPPGQQNEVMRQILEIAYVDGFFAPLEREMIDRVAHIWNWSTGEIDRLIQEVQESTIQNSISNVDEQSNLSSEARLLNNYKKSGLPDAFINIVKNLAPDTIGRKIEQLEREILLSGSEYDEAIEQCARVAREDYEYTKIALKKTNSILKNLGRNLSKVVELIQEQNNSKGKASNAKQVATELEKSIQALTTKIITNLEKVRQSTFAKQRALNYFSIAFMGRTKAGKSTLHAIITQNGWEAIGVGKQRTTRLIQEYEWKNIRIIDTPGISAPVDGGKIDEETAKSVIEESDVICCVVTNDSIQEPEFEFLKGLKDQAKPLIVLLNIKRNLRESLELKLFLKNPNKHFAMDGNSSLPGHFNRIRGYAKKHYSNDYFPIVPVMLIAAQLSYEVEHQEYKRRLFEASRIQDFLDLIRESLMKHGTIRRSQTLLGSTVGEIEEPAKWVTQQARKYKQLAATLETERETINKKLKKAAEDNRKSLLQKIETVYLQAKNAISPFAEDNYNSNKVSLELAWKKELEKINFAKRLKATYEETNQSFNNDVKEELEEVGHELQLIANLGGFEFDCKKQDTINFRDLFRIGGGILGLAGAIVFLFVPPVGIVMGIVAPFIGGLGEFSKSKDKKRREAVQNITSLLSSQIITHKQNTLQQAKVDFTKSCDSVVTTIDKYFKDLIQGLEEIYTHLELAQKGLDSTANYLNRAYAKRVVDWSTEQYEPLNDEGINKTIAKVKREFGNAITIQTRTQTQLKKSQEEMKQILQEDIFIETINY
jgi:small GTP-binding protein